MRITSFLLITLSLLLCGCNEDAKHKIEDSSNSSFSVVNRESASLILGPNPTLPTESPLITTSRYSKKAAYSALNLRFKDSLESSREAAVSPIQQSTSILASNVNWQYSDLYRLSELTLTDGVNENEPWEVTSNRLNTFDRGLSTIFFHLNIEDSYQDFQATLKFVDGNDNLGGEYSCNIPGGNYVARCYLGQDFPLGHLDKQQLKGVFLVNGTIVNSVTGYRVGPLFSSFEINDQQNFNEGDSYQAAISLNNLESAAEFKVELKSNGTVIDTAATQWTLESFHYYPSFPISVRLDNLPAGSLTVDYKIKYSGRNDWELIDSRNLSVNQTDSDTRIIRLSGDLQFGDVYVGNQSQKTATIHNDGTTTLNISHLELPNGFASAYSGAINPGATQQVQISFSPSSAINYQGDAVVIADHTSGVNSQVISGRGLNNNNNESEQARKLLMDYIADGFTKPMSTVSHYGYKYADIWELDDKPRTLHTGIDLNSNDNDRMDCGKEITAVANGIVRFEGLNGAWGGVVMLQHRFARIENGIINYTDITSQYGHIAILDDLYEGMYVYRGQKIGYVAWRRGAAGCERNQENFPGVSDPGYFDTNLSPHLHFELRSDVNKTAGAWPAFDNETIDGTPQERKDAVDGRGYIYPFDVPGSEYGNGFGDLHQLNNESATQAINALSALNVISSYNQNVIETNNHFTLTKEQATLILTRVAHLRLEGRLPNNDAQTIDYAVEQGIINATSSEQADFTQKVPRLIVYIMAARVSQLLAGETAPLPSLPDCQSSNFEDVNSSDSFCAHVNHLYENELFDGTEVATQQYAYPTAFATRNSVAGIAHRLYEWEPPLLLNWTGTTSLISYHGRHLANVSTGLADYPFGITQDITYVHNHLQNPTVLTQWQINENSCQRIHIDVIDSDLPANEKVVDISIGYWDTREHDRVFKNVQLPFVLGEENTDFALTSGAWRVVHTAFKGKLSKTATFEVQCTSQPATVQSYTVGAATLFNGDYQWQGNFSILSHMFKNIADNNNDDVDWPYGAFLDVTHIHPAESNPMISFQWQVWGERCKQLSIDVPDLPSNEKHVNIEARIWSESSGIQLQNVTLPITLTQSNTGLDLSDGNWRVVKIEFLNAISREAEVQVKCPEY